MKRFHRVVLFGLGCSISFGPVLFKVAEWSAEHDIGEVMTIASGIVLIPIGMGLCGLALACPEVSIPVGATYYCIKQLKD